MINTLSFMKQTCIAICLILCFQATSSLCIATEKSTNFAQRAEVKAFIRHMEKNHHYDPKYLVNLFKKISPEPKILSAIAKPYEKLPWYRYQELLVSEQRIQSGLQFWKEHEAMLQQAEAKYGVPAEIIIAIIGVETSYGKNKGSYPVLQTLATLAFDYPPRSNFFKKELEEFLLLIKEQGLNPLEMTGSYAGAIGLPQFMPSSYRKYAVDSGKGQTDLINNDFDAILSVANYFKMHGWQPNEAIASLAVLKNHRPDATHPLLNPSDLKNTKPSITLQKLEDNGVQSKTPVGFKNKNELAAFMALERAPNAHEYWLGLNNFYVITRYNHSTHYAMAVYKLSTRIKELKK
jgi:membrane-bound lytic murein transglycosylase B